MFATAYNKVGKLHYLIILSIIIARQTIAMELWKLYKHPEYNKH